MPLLVLVRHAKAEVPTGDLDDHDRALTLEGRIAAARLGERLDDAGIVPDEVFVSSANRAQQTWKRMAPRFEDALVHTVPELYGAGIGGYQAVLANARGPEVVMTVAHEPTASGFARWLADDDSDPDALAQLATGLVTSGAAVLEVRSWAPLRAGGARLAEIYSGKL